MTRYVKEMMRVNGRPALVEVTIHPSGIKSVNLDPESIEYLDGEFSEAQRAKLERLYREAVVYRNVASPPPPADDYRSPAPGIGLGLFVAVALLGLVMACLSRPLSGGVFFGALLAAVGVAGVFRILHVTTGAEPMSAWGKTGRVTLDSRDAELPGVRIDGKRVGWLYSPDQGHPRWGARTFDDAPAGFEWIDGAFLSLDAAVLWVLRRVDPALWRQERGDVWTVKRVPRVPGPPPWFGFPWQIINPAGVMVNAVTAMYAEVAIEDAARRAHAQAATR